MYLPNGLKCVVTTQQEAKAICWEYCQDDDPDKTFCFDDGCPLAQIEIQRCQELVRQIDRVLAVRRHNLMADSILLANMTNPIVF